MTNLTNLARTIAAHLGSRPDPDLTISEARDCLLKCADALDVTLIESFTAPSDGEYFFAGTLHTLKKGVRLDLRSLEATHQKLTGTGLPPDPTPLDILSPESLAGLKAKCLAVGITEDEFALLTSMPVPREVAQKLRGAPYVLEGEQ